MKKMTDNICELTPIILLMNRSNLLAYFSAQMLLVVNPTTIKCPHLCAIGHKIFMHHKIPNGQRHKEKNAALLLLPAGGPLPAYKIKFLIT